MCAFSFFSSSLSFLPVIAVGRLVPIWRASSASTLGTFWVFGQVRLIFASRCLYRRTACQNLAAPTVSHHFFFFFFLLGLEGCGGAKRQPSGLDAAHRWNLLLISSSPLKRFLAFLSSWISHQRVTFSPSLGCAACNRPPHALFRFRNWFYSDCHQ